MAEPTNGPAGAPTPAGGEGLNEEIEHPTKLLRVAGMVRTMLDQVQAGSLDEPGRQRLAEVHNQLVETLRDLLSADLREELDQFRFESPEDAPSGPELRVAEAQLSGWLQGLLQGIQASIASQQLSAQQQLQQMQQQQQLPGSGAQPRQGQYL